MDRQLDSYCMNWIEKGSHCFEEDRNLGMTVGVVVSAFVGHKDHDMVLGNLFFVRRNILDIKGGRNCFSILYTHSSDDRYRSHNNLAHTVQE